MRYARAARRYIVTTALTGAVTALLVVAQAYLVSRSVAPVVTDGTPPQTLGTSVALLAAVLVARVVVVHVQESLAHRAATRTIADLRRQVLTHGAALGPRWLARNGSDTATLLTRGLDDLEPYFTRYLPQLLLASTVTPLTALVMFVQDIPSTVTVAVTIPLVPIFMILIGRLTQRHSEERLEAMERLGGQVLDLLAGLPTLKALGREIGPARRVRAVGRAYNATTMQTLKVAFLSGAVLEFITTLSVAIVAVEVGFRLLFGRLDLATGLLVIMIAPEVYQPLRQVGFHFHASANGVAAAEAVFGILATPAPEHGCVPAPDLRTATVRIESLSVASRGTWAPADLTATIAPGRLVALTGASGAGKTTTAQVLLGLLPADRGRVRVVAADGTDVPLSEIAPADWWAQVAWVPQRPVIVPGTVRTNVLGDDDPPDHAFGDRVPERLERAARATGLAEVVASLPRGWDTPVGQGGVGLSVGQRQRIGLTRALVSEAPLVVLDEPTAHLDAAGEAHVLAGVEALRAERRTVVVVAHRAVLVAMADDVVEVVSRPDDTAAPGADDDTNADAGAVTGTDTGAGADRGGWR